MNQLLDAYPVLLPCVLGLLAVLVGNLFLALLPLVGGRDSSSVFPHN